MGRTLVSTCRSKRPRCWACMGPPKKVKVGEQSGSELGNHDIRKKGACGSCCGETEVRATDNAVGSRSMLRAAAAARWEATARAIPARGSYAIPQWVT